MRVGLVCPYSVDVPGGVQLHVHDLAAFLRSRGHQVSVLAPSGDDEAPGWVVPAGRAVPVPYNGSTARLAFGPLAAARVRRWLEEGAFDLLHLHEPVVPSLSLLALWQSTGPVVATVHSSTPRSRALQLVQPLLRPSLERISARIAVSEDARRTVVDHLGGDAVVIPNGIRVDAFAAAAPRPGWTGSADAPVVGFLGRLDEPRKGLDVLLAALPELRARRPGVRVLLAGPGEAPAAVDRPGVERLGRVDEAAKRAFFASVDVYVAPHTGGESFGIVLLEALAGGAPVVASDLGAFRRVLTGEDGQVRGRLVPPGDAPALAAAVTAALTERRRGAERRPDGLVQRYDWERVGEEVLAVYETVTDGTTRVGSDPRGRSLLSRWLAS